MPHLKLNTDKDVHEQTYRNCRACIGGEALFIWGHGGMLCNGMIHREHRYNQEAGVLETFILLRCDKCDYEEFVLEDAYARPVDNAATTGV